MPAAGKTIKPLVRLGRHADDCWHWLGATTPAGHGKKTYCGRDVMAHRWVWEMLFGPVPAGLVVYTTCTTTGCTNPAHLACGYQAEACRNSIAAKLLPADIAEIRAAHPTAGSNTARVLADRYGVTSGHIREIWRGATWKRAKRHTPPNQRRVAS